MSKPKKTCGKSRKKKPAKTEAKAKKIETPTTTQKMRSNLSKSTAIVFCFDTTGSMSPAIAQVRANLRDLAEQMTQDIPGLKIGLIAHGDYCDGTNAILYQDLTDDIGEIMKFINDTPNTSGGDAPECYELALNRARSLSWPAEGGSLVMIGDATPHEPDYPANTDRLDWRKEIEALKAMKVDVFPMQCLGSPHRTEENKFWEGVSALSETPLLLLESFTDSANTLASVAYASAGAEVYGTYMERCADADAEAASKGLELCSMNLCDNRAKLSTYASSRTTKE